MIMEILFALCFLAMAAVGRFGILHLIKKGWIQDVLYVLYICIICCSCVLFNLCMQNPLIEDIANNKARIEVHADTIIKADTIISVNYDLIYNNK